jgi:hypothetical protein
MRIMVALKQVFQTVMKFTVAGILAEKTRAQNEAMQEFFGMHADADVVSIETELRTLRKGRRGAFED